MEYSKNAKYGKTKCFHCLLSPDREEAAIFIGINKVASRPLDTNGVSVYPCKVLVHTIRGLLLLIRKT
jgi:hypothetical protein